LSRHLAAGELPTGRSSSSACLRCMCISQHTSWQCLLEMCSIPVVRNARWCTRCPGSGEPVGSGLDRPLKKHACVSQGAHESGVGAGLPGLAYLGVVWWVGVRAPLQPTHKLAGHTRLHVDMGHPSLAAPQPDKPKVASTPHPTPGRPQVRPGLRKGLPLVLHAVPGTLYEVAGLWSGA
jgi:hypothetical protein